MGESVTFMQLCVDRKRVCENIARKKNSMLFERTTISKKLEETKANDIQNLRDDKKMSLDMFYRDPYILNFLGLKDTFSEKDLENAILARQKHFIFDSKDYYMDLLFYHKYLRRLVLIELKLGEFEYEYKGHVELYLRWLNKYILLNT